ncbi:hypothetical protein NSTCB13_03558 [Nostoc sp. DSM 114160]|jgi:hypothetical protein
MNILEEKLGCADLEAALTAPLETKEKQLAGVS